jgi:DNA end-binding protein Ku
MIGPKGNPLKRKYYSQESGKNLDDTEMVRGYEIEKDEYVIVTDQELDRLAPEKTRDIDLRRFVDQDSIPPIYFDRSYFLTPAGETQKAYRLLAETMEDAGRAGIGTFVMRGKEYLVAILAQNGILRAETLRFADELRSPADVGLPDKKKVEKAALSRFERLIKSKTKPHLMDKVMKDAETARVLKLVEKKRSRGKDVVETDDADGADGNVVDIMDVLKASLRKKKD